MKERRAIVGLCMLCALLISAFAAQSASAITGTTAFTCVLGAGDKTLRGEHCLSEGVAVREYGHVAIAQDNTTILSATNAGTGSITVGASVWTLKVTIAGVPLELQATGVTGSGFIANRVSAGGEHYANGDGTLTFTGVTVKSPAERGCKVYTHNETVLGEEFNEGEVGVIHTSALKGTTEGQGDNLRFEPAAIGAKNFANFFVTCEAGKKVAAIEGTWSCTGSVKGQPSGATTNFTHATVTTENTLKCKGTKAGVNGSLTLSGGLTPLSATTVTT